jgi:hypothetical protein
MEFERLLIITLIKDKDKDARLYSDDSLMADLDNMKTSFIMFKTAEHRRLHPYRMMLNYPPGWSV